MRRRHAQYLCTYIPQRTSPSLRIGLLTWRLKPGQNKDGHYTYVHFRSASLADQWDDFCQDRLPDDVIYVPPHLEPLNPEHEDEVIPNQHAAFGIQQATQLVE